MKARKLRREKVIFRIFASAARETCTEQSRFSQSLELNSNAIVADEAREKDENREDRVGMNDDSQDRCFPTCDRPTLCDRHRRRTRKCSPE